MYVCRVEKSRTQLLSFIIQTIRPIFLDDDEAADNNIIMTFRDN